MIKQRLFFSLNVDKRFSRQIQTIEYLSTMSDPVPINVLTSKIGCSIPTMRTDIRSINSDFSHFLEIKSLGKRGYTLILHDDISIHSIIMELARETDVFKIIDALFHNKVYAFDDMVSDFYVNPSTLRNILVHVNEVVQDFDISITTSPIEFQGSETDIRLFFFYFYYDFNDYLSIDKDYSDDYKAYQTIINDSRYALINQIHLSHFRATQWIMIIRNRITTKCFVTIDIEFKSKIIAQEDYSNFEKTFIQAFSRLFGINHLPLDDIVWAYVALLHCISYSEPSDNLLSPKRYDYLLIRDYDRQLLNNVNVFLGLEFSNEILENVALDKMRSFLINSAILTNLSLQFQRLSISLRSLMKTQVYDLYMLWMKHLYSREGQALFPIKYRKDIALSLAMLHYSIVNSLEQSEVKVLFAFQGEAGYDDFLLKQAKYMLPNKAIPYYLFNQSVSDINILDLGIDLIVTNFDAPELNHLKCKVVQFSYVPSIEEWSELGSMIFNISSNSSSQHF